METTYRDTRELPGTRVLALYRANHWFSAGKPCELQQALRDSHAVITAWDGEELVGLWSPMARQGSEH